MATPKEDATRKVIEAVDRLFNDPYGMFPGLYREDAEERIREEWRKTRLYAEENDVDLDEVLEDRTYMVGPEDAERLERILDNDPDYESVNEDPEDEKYPPRRP
jgi:hypothetical protein